MRCKSYGTFASAVASAVLACSAPIAISQAAITRFEIPAQPLANSLRDVGRQANINVLVDPPVVKEFQGPALHAEITPGEALTRLLAGTGVTHEFLNEKTVIIASSDSPGVIRLAQANTSARSTGDQQSGGTPLVRETLEEVIVTAQKRQERAFDVPISLAVMSTEELQRRKIASIDDLALAVPSMTVQSSGSAVRRIFLRGISNVTGTSSLIGMYLDEASVTSSPFFQLDVRTYDLERVEVLRGPQGTLYGEGSIGGTIRFITKNPQLDRFAMNADVAAMLTEGGAASQRIESAINLPVIQSELGLRIAGTFDHQGGWIDQPAAGRPDFNDQNLRDVRVKGLWQPTPQLTINTMAVLHRNDGSINTGEDASGNFTQVLGLTDTPSARDDYELYNLTLAYDFPAARLLSTSSYIEQDKLSRNQAQLIPVSPPGPDQVVFQVANLHDANKPKSVSQELRLTSLGSSPWQWTIGGFYRRFENEQDFALIFSLPLPVGTPLPDPISDRASPLSKSWATFGDMSYRLTDRFTIGAGLRYFEDEQENRISHAAAKFNSLNPRVYVQYKLTEAVNTYASAAKGFRSGGINNFPAGAPPFEPETVWTYELGAKISALNGRISAEGAVFYSDYSDYQILAVLPETAPFAITSNAGTAEIRGIEWGLTWHAADRWSLSFNGNYVDTEFRKINGAFPTHAVGDPLDLFPEYGLTLSTQRDFNWNDKSGFIRLDYGKLGRSSYRNRRADAGAGWYLSKSDIIDMLNLNASVQWNANLSLGLFAQNLLDERGFTDPFSIEGVAARARPRTYGIAFGLSFD